MTDDRPDPEVAILHAAIQLPAGQRASYLDKVCGGNEALRRRIEDLIEAIAEAGDFLDGPAPGVGRVLEGGHPAALEGENQAAVVPSERVGDRIGRYKLLQQIGEGGCGVVYMAEQEEPVRRKVALKVIKLGMDTKGVIARFEAERQALALMDHASIAKVLDAGATHAGRPYFVMELVRGIKITDYCDENNLSAAARLMIFVQVCQAIQHAHQKGIIHRDIKPSNILVADHDGVPVPKIIDFGIAKATTDQRLTDKTLFTAFEQFIGTPAYMSPEQARLSGMDIDTRSDIYSLGVLLYELLTGRTPFDAGELMQTGLDEMRRTIQDKEPLRPSTCLSTMSGVDLTGIANHRRTEAPRLINAIRGDLDWIVMKALEKDRKRRYETANGLAKDVQRHLNDEPVLARPPGSLYLLQKLVRRHKLAFSAGLIVAVSLIFGLGVATVALIRIKQGDQQIRLAKDDATEKLRAAYLAEARALRTSGQAGQRFASLEAVQKAAAIHSDLDARNEAIASLAVSDLRVSKEVIITGHARNEAAIFDLNLEKYAFGDTNGNITIRAASNHEVIMVLPAPGYTLEAMGNFSANGKYLSARYRREHEGQTYWVWDVENQKTIVRAIRQEDTTNLVDFNFAGDFSSDSRFFAASRSDGTISVFELGSGRQLKHFPAKRFFNHLILEPRNSRLACSSMDDSKVEIRDFESGGISQTLNCPAGVSAIAWSADGKYLATACLNFSICIWDVGTGQRKVVLEGALGFIISVAFNRDGSLLASSGWDGVSRLWNLDSGRQIASYPGGGWTLQFSPDDLHLIGWQNIGRYGSLEVARSRECRPLYVQRDGGFASSPEFSADGRILAAGSDDKLRFWDVSAGREITSLRQKYATVIFHPDGREAIVIDRTNINRRSFEHIGGTGSSAYRLGKPVHFFEAQEIQETTLSRDGRHLGVTQILDGQSVILDLQDSTAKVVLPGQPNVSRIAVSPDGHWAATGAWLNSQLKIWDARSGDLVRSISMPARTWVTFSPDGQWLATSSQDYQLLEVGSWQPKGPAQPGYEDPALDFTIFTTDGKLMARTDGRKILLLETPTEKLLATLEAPGFSSVTKLKFSPDGSQLAAVHSDQQVQLWDLRLIREELKPMHLDWDMPPYPSPGEAAAASPVTLEVESEAADPTAQLPAK